MPQNVKKTALPDMPAHVAGKKDCPVFMALGLLANKWSISILRELILAEGHTLRFSALKKALANITQRELTKHLRNFEESGIVRRTIYPERPPRVEYMLTELGTSLNEQIRALSRWAEDNGAEIQRNRAAFRERELAYQS